MEFSGIKDEQEKGYGRRFEKALTNNQNNKSNF